MYLNFDSFDSVVLFESKNESSEPTYDISLFESY